MKLDSVNNKRAFTLIETIISLSIVSVLFVGLSGAVMIGSFALPTPTDSGIVDRTVIDSLNLFRNDLKQASVIQYRAAASDIEFTLTMKNAGEAGQKNSIVYRYTDSTNSFGRKADSETAVTLFENISGFTMQFITEGTDISVVKGLIVVKGTIQPTFEIHAILPDKPEFN